MRWTGYVANTEELRNAHKILVGKPQEKILLGRPMQRWKDNIKIDMIKNCVLDIINIYSVLHVVSFNKLMKHV
jgi:hypothetical protein